MEVKIKRLEPHDNLQTHCKNGLDLEKLTFGFIRRIIRYIETNSVTSNYSNMPEPIMRISVEYGVEFCRAFFGIYDELRSTIECNKEYQLLKGNTSHYVAADIIYLSIVGFEQGIHEIVMKCISSHPNDKFGICENVNIKKLCKHDFGRIYLYNEVFGERYYWWKHTNYVWGKANSYKNVQHNMQWGNGDTIKMIVNCNHWTVQFFKNNEKVIDACPIKKNVKYYPVMATGDIKGVYQHVLSKQ
eukprot:533937_1